MFRVKKNSTSKIVVTVLSTIITLSLSYSLASASSTNGTNINFRKGPGTEYEAYDQKLNLNTEVNIIDIEGDWLKVSVNGTVGYINSKYVNVNDTNATVNDEPVRMRTTPAFDNNIYEKAKLYKGQRVLVLNKECIDGNEFYAIEYNKQKLYVFCSLIDLDDVAIVEDNTKELEDENNQIEEIAKKALTDDLDDSVAQVAFEESDSMNATVNCDTLNVRKRPSQYSSRVCQIHNGNRLSLIGQNSLNGTWYCFLYEGEQVWVKSDFVLLDEGLFLPIIETEKLSIAEEIVEFAKSFERSHRQEYLNGNQLWYDCSSYVRYVYANFGIVLSGGSKDIARSNAGQLISYEELQPGDLVFVHNNGSEIGHVGIYVGNDMMISNESSSVLRYDGTYGGGIKISTLNSGYYWPNYAKEYMRINNIQ